MNTSKISDNPTPKKIKIQVKGLKTIYKIYKFLPFKKKLFPSLEEAFNEFNQVEKEIYILDLPDEFNNLFAKNGWIAYDSLNPKILEKAISLYKEKGLTFSENYLSDIYDDKLLKDGIFRLSRNIHFKKRIRLIELLKKDYLEERYHACIPLLLSLIDGLVNDISKHVGFFAENVDLTAWDCISGHESGLPLLSEILRKSRKKTNDELIYIPYRNGILHGKELSFDNKIVAAKCWAILFAVFDWCDSLDNEKIESESISWKKLYEDIKKNNHTNKLLNDWEPRKDIDVVDLIEKNTPENTVYEFLNNWTNKRYGLLSERLIDFSNLPSKKKAGIVRNEFGKFIPSSFKLNNATDEAFSVTHIKVDLFFTLDKKNIKKELTIRVIYEDINGNPLSRSDEKGYWKIVKNSLSDVIYAHSLK